MSRPPCRIDGCDAPNNAHGLCTKHVTRLRRHGDPLHVERVWREASPCVVCGSEERTIKSRFVCSKRCERLYYTYDGAVPSERTCVLCGQVTQLDELTARGSRRRVSGRLCDQCQRLSWRTACLTAAQLAERDGTDCSLCGETVDMALKRQDSWMCPSIDHVVPRSHGGSNEPSNLALAHLICNVRKNNRVTA